MSDHSLDGRDLGPQGAPSYLVANNLADTTIPPPTDFKAFWDGEAQRDIARVEPTPPNFKLVARNLPGALLLALAKKRIYTYAIADTPKLDWLARAFASVGDHVLDVGVRTGTNAVFLRKLGKRVYGIDLAQRYIDYCLSEGYIDAGAVCNIESDDIPVPSAFREGCPSSYDAVFISEVIEHVLDGQRVLKNLARVIRPGGYLILTTPNLAYFGNRIRLLLGRDLDVLTMDRGEIGNQHIRVFTARLLKRMCGNVGLRVDMVGSDGVPIGLNHFLSVRGGAGSDDMSRNFPAMITFPGSRWPLTTLGRSIYIRAIRM